MLRWIILVGGILVILGLIIGVIVALAGYNRTTEALNRLEARIEEGSQARIEPVNNQQQVYSTPAVTTRTEAERADSASVSVANPQDPTQSEIRHPASYVETGISGRPVTYRINVPTNHVGIVGAFQVDNQSGGVYMVLGPGQYHKTIMDGFVLIIREQWAQEEWEFRLSQARRQGWALQHVDNGTLGVSTSTQQDSTLIQPETQTGSTTGQRQTTGVSGTLQFPAGIPVCGDTIVLQTGRTFRDTCFHSAPSAGTVTNGVIYPFADEFSASSIDPN